MNIKNKVWKCMLSLFFSAMATIILAQPGYEGDKKLAVFHLGNQNYKAALTQFLLLVKKDSSNAENLMLTALCYLNSSTDKSKAIYYYEKASRLPKFDKPAWYDLGKAYMYDLRFDDAIKAFNTFIASGAKEDNPVKASRMIEMCKVAPEMMKHPVAVDIELLDDRINSPYSDFNPYVTSDESTLFYTSKRQGGNLGGDGLFGADIYYSNFVNNYWTKAKKTGITANSNANEECTGLTSDGSEVVFTSDNEKGESKIFRSKKLGKNFKKGEAFGGLINLPQGNESAGALSPDKSTLYFSSDRLGGKGGKDIYVSKLLPGGEWSAPINLGEAVNTPDDEDNPYVSPDGTRLYFSSTGHNGMGGYDLFVSTIDTIQNTYSAAENLGYPINTVMDDKTISFTGTGKHAYISRCLPDGYGESDVYRLTFKDVSSKPLIIRGKIFSVDSVNVFSVYQVENKILHARLDSLKNEIGKMTEQNTHLQALLNETLLKLLELDASYKTTITAKDEKTQEVKGVYTPNLQNGSFLMILQPGMYTLEIECAKFSKYKMNYQVLDYEFQEEVIPLKVYMNSVETIKKSPLNKKKKTK